MRVLLLALSMMFASSAFAANNNPWMRACRIEAGQFWVLKTESNSELVMCFFNNAAIGAEALFLFKSNQGVSKSIQAYKNRKSSGARGGVCGSFGATLVQGSDAEGQEFNICRFSDGSVIEETTLWLGPGAGGHGALDRALSSTY